ncbi:MAG TPA: CYCXC family (seleno)protein [Candidatus Acidoferrum sp.]
MKRTFACGIILLSSAIGLMLAPGRAVLGLAAQTPGAEDIPVFHADAPKGPLPDTMDPDAFPDPVMKNAYTVAGRVKKVLYQQPCYCHCDRSQGHGSLLDCFTSRHGSGCGTCMAEDFYSYEQTRKGKTPAQIREGIEKGEWQKVDLSKYQQPLAEK